MQLQCLSRGVGMGLGTGLGQRRWAHHSVHTFRYAIVAGKPPSLPPAKTKRYEVQEPPWMPPAAVRELLWRRQAYKTALASIRELFREELAQSQGRLGIDEDIRRCEEEDEELFRQRLQANDAANARLAKEREGRLKEDEGRLAQEVHASVSDFLRAEAAERAAAQAELDAAKDAAARLVTRETLEERVLEALETPVQRDFCIDRLGIQYVPSLPLPKYLDAPVAVGTKWLYQTTPNPLVVADQDQRRLKAQEAGIDPDARKEQTFAVAEIF